MINRNAYLISFLSKPNNTLETTEPIISASKYIRGFPIVGTTNIPP